MDFRDPAGVKDAWEEMWQRQPESLVKLSDREGDRQKLGESTERQTQIRGGVDHRRPIAD